MKHRILLWGASGHAKVVADIIRLRNEFEIAGFIDDIASSRTGEFFCGCPIFGGREQLSRLSAEGVRHLILAFGNCAARLELAAFAIAQGFSLGTAIHPSAIIANDVEIGHGTVIAAGAVVNTGVKIGANVIVNTSSSIDHESVIEDGVHICPGVHLAGDVHVSRGAWIGIGSSIIEKVKIGSGAVIGAGSVVVSDIPPFSLAYGVPAKVKKRIEL